jgi:hypothetical protein
LELVARYETHARELAERTVLQAMRFLRIGGADESIASRIF